MGEALVYLSRIAAGPTWQRGEDAISLSPQGFSPVCTHFLFSLWFRVIAHVISRCTALCLIEFEWQEVLLKSFIIMKREKIICRQKVPAVAERRPKERPLFSRNNNLKLSFPHTDKSGNILVNWSIQFPRKTVSHVP